MPEATTETNAGGGNNGESGLGTTVVNEDLKSLFGDDGPATGAPVAKPSADVNADDNQPPAEELDENGAPKEPAPQAPAKVPTADEIADRMMARWAQQQPQAPAPPQKKEYTDDELDQMFSVFKPSPELLAELRSEDEQVAIGAVLKIRDGLMAQQMKVTEALIAQALEAQQQQIAPAVQLAKKAQSEAAEKAFYEPNKDLVPHKKIVNMVFSQFLLPVAQGGRRFASAAEATKAVADETRAILKELNVPIVPPTGTEPQQQNRQMQPLARGGAGGSSSGRSAAPSGISAQLRELA